MQIILQASGDDTSTKSEKSEKKKFDWNSFNFNPRDHFKPEYLIYLLLTTPILYMMYYYSKRIFQKKISINEAINEVAKNNVKEINVIS